MTASRAHELDSLTPTIREILRLDERGRTDSTVRAVLELIEERVTARYPTVSPADELALSEPETVSDSLVHRRPGRPPLDPTICRDELREALRKVPRSQWTEGAIAREIGMSERNLQRWMTRGLIPHYTEWHRFLDESSR